MRAVLGSAGMGKMENEVVLVVVGWDREELGGVEHWGINWSQDGNGFVFS